MAKHRITRKLRGLEERHILDEHKQLRDVRSIWVQITDPFKLRAVTFCCMGGYVIIPFVMPIVTNIMLFLGIMHFIWFLREWKDETLPMRLPCSANQTDYSDPIPGRKKYFKSSGVMFFGNELRTNRELWANLRDCLTHIFVCATTGSGKTEILHGLSFGGALATCGGYYYVDPKGSTKLPMQIYTMCRMCGRDDDFRVLNYQSGSKQNYGPKISRSSNTNNPFAFGSAEALTQLLVSLIPNSSGDNAIFAQNAQTLITALMFGLVELRDKHGQELNINTIRRHMSLTEYVKLAVRKDLSRPTRDALHSFLASVGWRADKGNDEDPMSGQPRSFPEQFGYARSYFGLSLASLTDTYGNIYNTEFGEVDLYDVIMSRRICCVLLPSLAKSPQELENLGKISLSALKNACAVGLGDGTLEGTVEDILEALPTDSNTVFMSITDEMESIPTPGFSSIYTQARSLGVVGCCATQSYGGLKGSDEKGAQQIIENTKIKIFGTVESGEGTWELVDKLSGGDAKVLQSDGYHIPQPTAQREQGIQFSYRDQGHAKVSSMKRVTLRDLQNQIEGEYHLFFRGHLIRGESFYTDVPLESAQQLRVAHMLKVKQINTEKYFEILDIAKNLKRLTQNQKEYGCSNEDHLGLMSLLTGEQTITEEECIATVLNTEHQQEIVPSPVDSMIEENTSEIRLEKIDTTAATFATTGIDDCGKRMEQEGFFQWLEVDYAGEIVDIEKQLGATHDEAIASTGKLLVETAKASAKHPTDPVPTKNPEKVKRHLHQMITYDDRINI